MATFPRITVLAAVAAIVVMLSGCLAPSPAPTATPVPSASAVFASEEEALAAATAAYTAYLEMSDLILSEGGAEPERIEPFVSPSYAEEELAQIVEFRNAGSRTEGRSTFDSIRVQQGLSANRADETLTAYLCYDVSDVRLLNADGQDVTPADRPARVPLEVDFELTTEQPAKLLLGRSDVWSGENFC